MSYVLMHNWPAIYFKFSTIYITTAWSDKPSGLRINKRKLILMCTLMLKKTIMFLAWTANQQLRPTSLLQTVRPIQNLNWLSPRFDSILIAFRTQHNASSIGTPYPLFFAAKRWRRSLHFLSLNFLHSATLCNFSETNGGFYWRDNRFIVGVRSHQL